MAVSNRLELASPTTHSHPEPARPRSGIAPRAVLRPEALSYRMVRPRDAGVADIPLLGEAYRCWSEVWKQTLSELDNATHVPSDDFTRQDAIGALFHGFECIGMTGYRWVDLAIPIYAEDSYFKVWSRENVAAACADGTRICIGSNLTVAPLWRSAHGLSAKELLLALSIEHFKRSPADTMVGTLRNNRGMNDLGYRLGFRPLARDVVHHGVDVDLVALHRERDARRPLDPETEAALASLLA